MPPILPLPARPGAFVRTEDILAHHLRKIFKIYQIEEQAVVSVTRNADISYDEAMDQEDLDLRAQMTKLLRQRERLAPVRLEMQGEAPALQAMLLRRLRLTAEQSYVCTCPLVLKYAYQLDSLDSALFYPPHAPAYPAWLDREVPMWEQIRQRDVLLFYPYHSMQPFLDLLRQSAADPAVVSIQMTIYRVAGKSAVIKHLCAAAENGKAVNVVKNYAGTYDDPAKGKECALALHDQGADVIFQIASATGDGVFEAAKENGFYAIGVDSDQKYIDPDTIICSMKKEVGSSIYDAVKRLLDGDSSLWGTTWVADMSNGYVGIGYGEDGAAQQVPDDVKNAVEELSKKIVSGEITVETTR